jgi:hypothetical protein
MILLLLIPLVHFASITEKSCRAMQNNFSVTVISLSLYMCDFLEKCHLDLLLGADCYEKMDI